MRRNVPTVLVAALASLACPAYGQQDRSGERRTVGETSRHDLRVATYRPPNCTPRLVLAVFHGNDRNAGPHRNVSRAIANTTCAIVVAPRFEKQQFSNVAFCLGGGAFE